MDIIQTRDRRTVEVLDSVSALPATGYVWLDCVRGEDDERWPQLVEQLTGVRVHERHQKDTANGDHPSFADYTSEYEIIIFRSLAPESGHERFPSRATAFLIFDHLLVTVRPADSRSVLSAKERILNLRGRVPIRPVGLMHLIMSTMVDRFLSLRDPLSAQLDEWRRNLLDPNHPFNDWLALMEYRSQLRTLALLCEGQEDAVGAWRDFTDIEIDDHLAVRYNDLMEHIRRVRKFAEDQQSEVESLVQLHFSAVAHRTNEIMRVLTVVSAIFLPLSFLAGIFGMNFENMPELKHPYGYFIALGAMATLAIGLLILFRIRRWI